MADSVYKYFVVRSVPLFSFFFRFCVCVRARAHVFFWVPFNYFLLFLFLFLFHNIDIVDASRIRWVFFFHRRSHFFSRICQDNTGLPARPKKSLYLVILPPHRISHKMGIWSMASCSEFLRLLCCNTCELCSFDRPTNCKSFSTHFNLHGYIVACLILRTRSQRSGRP